MFSALGKSFGELQQGAEHRLDLLMEMKSGLLEVKEKYESCREPGNGVGFVWGFEVVGEEVQEGSWDLQWSSLRVSTGVLQADRSTPLPIVGAFWHLFYFFCCK